MSLFSFYWLLVFLSFLVPFVSSVVTMGGLLFVSSLVCTVVVGWSVGSWYGFILFLVYITGLLVLFGYMLAMSPNDKFTELSSVVLGVGLVLGGVMCMVWWGSEFKVSLLLDSDFQSLASGIYMGYNFVLYLFFGVFLFMALVMVVNMSYKSPKALRGFLG